MPHCKLTHPKPCLSDSLCFKNDCKFFHTVGKCEVNCIGKKDCKLRHVKKNQTQQTGLVKLCSTGNCNLSCIQCLDIVSTEFNISIEKFNIVEKSIKSIVESKGNELNNILIQNQNSLRVLKTHQELITSMNKNLDYSNNSIKLIKEKFENLKQQNSKTTLIQSLRDQIAKIYRETWRLEKGLPALSKKSSIEEELIKEKPNFMIIKGHTGSGKSTQLPQYIVDMEHYQGKSIICTQPRKLAVTSLAERVSVEFKANNPCTISSKQQKVSVLTGGKGAKYSIKPGTINFCTESTLISLIGELLKDESLLVDGAPSNWIDQKVGAIIIDEAHERNINTDLLIGLLKKHNQLWKNLKIIVTSASLDSKLFLKYLNNCPIIEIPGKTFPVEVIYSNSKYYQTSTVSSVVSKAIEICKYPGGDILCFLTGQEEVEKAKSKFDCLIEKLDTQTTASLKVFSLSLYGKQLPEEQKKVFEKTPKGSRKVIFSTDVAETSITIDGLEFVIDSGLTKSNIYDAQRNTMALKVHSISKSSADQRKGRAGRTGPGKCFRLYSSSDYESMEEGIKAEIFRRPLSTLAATLLHMNINPLSFDWIESPSKKSMISAISQLETFNAIKRDFEITDDTPNNGTSNALNQIGEMVVKLQVDPGIMNMIYNSCKYGFGESSTIIAGIMNVGSTILWRGGDDESKKDCAKKHSKLNDQPLFDVASFYHIFCTWVSKNSKLNRGEGDEKISNNEHTKWCQENSLNNKALGIVSSSSNELINVLKDYDFWKAADQNLLPTVPQIRMLCLFSQYNNIAIQIKPGFYKTIPLSSNGISIIAHIHPSSIVKRDSTDSIVSNSNLPETVIYHGVLNTSRSYLTLITPIDNVNLIDEVGYNGLKEKVEECRTNTKIEQVSIENVSRFILLSIVGKGGSNSDLITKELGCENLDVRMKDEIFSCWYVPSKVSGESIKLKMLAMVEKVRDKLAKEAIEEEYVGQTRVVYSSGLKVIEIFTNTDKFTSVNISKLPNSINSSTDLSKFLVSNIFDKNKSKSFDGKVGESLIRNVSFHPHDKNPWSTVMLYDSKIAHEVRKSINGEMFGGKEMECTIGGILPPSTSSSIVGTLSISLNNNLGNGKLTFEKNDDAQKVFGVQLPQLRFTDCTDNSIKFQIQKGCDIDEDDIKSYLFKNSLPNAKKIILFRSTDDLNYNSILDIDALIPHSKNIDSGVEFVNKKTGVYGFRYFFDKPENLQDYAHSLNQQQPSKYKYRVQYSSNVSCHFTIEKLNHNEIKSLIENFKKESYGNKFKTQTNEVNSNNYSFEYQVVSYDLTMLKNVISKYQSICNPKDIFTHKNKELIFSHYGRKCMAKLSSTTYLYWNNKTHTIMIYSKSDQETIRAKNDLNNLISNLETLKLDQVLKLNLNGQTQLKEQLKTDSDHYVKSIKGLKETILLGRNLIVTGTQQSIDSLKLLIKDKLIGNGKELIVKQSDCSICFDSVELYSLQICGHSFCRTCLQDHMLLSGLTHQTCPQCNGELAICDIINLCPNDEICALKRRSVLHFQRQNSNQFVNCPNPLCDQLLDTPTSKDYNSDDFYRYCDQCKKSYCFECSSTDGKPTNSHKGRSCQADTQYNALVELLNTKCPVCKRVFYEFDGCFAVTCDNCKGYFCGFCFTTSNNSSDNHTHVKFCTNNPEKGQYFSSKVVFNNYQNQVKKQNFLAYLDNIKDVNIKKKYTDDIRKLAKDLNI